MKKTIYIILLMTLILGGCGSKTVDIKGTYLCGSRESGIELLFQENASAKISVISEDKVYDSIDVGYALVQDDIYQIGTYYVKQDKKNVILADMLSVTTPSESLRYDFSTGQSCQRQE